METLQTAEPVWVSVPTGHTIALRDGQIVARNAKGKELKSVPPAVKKTGEFAELQRLLDWVAGHEREAAVEVDKWLTCGLPVPIELIVQVWADPPGADR